MCVVGDSHVGALKLAFERKSDPALGWHVDFFGAAHDGIGRVALSGGTLFATEETVREAFLATSGGTEGIDVAAYDGFLVVSGGLSFGILVRRICSTHLPAALGDRERFPISLPCLEACLMQSMDRGAAMRVSRLVRSVSAVPVLFVPAPRPAAAIRDHPDPDVRNIMAAPVLGFLRPAYDRVLHTLSEAAGIGVLAQPPETVEDLYYTRDRYRENGVNVRGRRKDPRTNYGHMNGDYGALVLAAAIQALEAGLIR